MIRLAIRYQTQKVKNQSCAPRDPTLSQAACRSFPSSHPPQPPELPHATAFPFTHVRLLSDWIHHQVLHFQDREWTGSTQPDSWCPPGPVIHSRFTPSWPEWSQWGHETPHGSSGSGLRASQNWHDWEEEEQLHRIPEEDTREEGWAAVFRRSGHCCPCGGAPA